MIFYIEVTHERTVAVGSGTKRQAEPAGQPPPAVVMRSGVGRGRFVVLNVRLGGVMAGVLMIAVREVGVMRGGFVLARFVVLGGFLMVARRVLVMFGCCVMVFRCFWHAFPPTIALSAIECGASYLFTVAPQCCGGVMAR